jgi:hypothetical protein
MFAQLEIRLGGICTTGIVLLFALTPVGECQTVSNQKEEPALPDAIEENDEIEEIVVYGSKSLGQLRDQIRRAEVKVFDLFNSFNNDDEFDIHCRKVAPTGSRIKKRVCSPNYVADLVAKETAAFWGGMPFVYPSALVRRKGEILQAKMEALLMERPDLAKALNEFTIATQVYDSEHKRRCEGRVFLCRR